MIRYRIVVLTGACVAVCAAIGAWCGRQIDKLGRFRL